MKFYSEEKELSVFNRRKKIANFTNGEFETDNPDVIEKLKPHFRCEESPKVLSGLSAFIKLKKEATKLGINTKGMKKKDLIKALEEY
ncbi:MAG TPA: hypothetical protein VMX17_11240 [Candidatus Glassbacteria bacterium]|nr:hypothetical protein [Candidatus Glassbacteria bacterium]